MFARKLFIHLLITFVIAVSFQSMTRFSEASIKTTPAHSGQIADGFLVSYYDTKKLENLSDDKSQSPKPVQGTEYYVISAPKEASAKELNVQAIKILKEDSNIKTIQPNFIYKPFYISNDTEFTNQWALRNTGQIGGLVGFDLDAERLWDFEDELLTSTTVAVIDTGFDVTHPDLQGSFVAGWDFTDGDNFPFDFDGHGTHVAGIISAQSNNSVGVSGLSRYNKLTVMPLKVDFTSAQIISAIQLAIDNSVPVINASWGGSYYDSAMYTKISQYPGLFIAAAGNGGFDGVGDNIDISPVYPASYNLDNIIAVGSYTRYGTRSSFSNYGTTVDVYAPGSDIRSTYLTFNPVINDTFESSTIGVGINNSSFAVTQGTWSIMSRPSDACTVGTCGTKGLTTGNNRQYLNDEHSIITQIAAIDTSAFSEPPRLAFHLSADIEEDFFSYSCPYDYIAVEVDNSDDNWTELAKICGTWNEEIVINNALKGNATRFRFIWHTDENTTGTAPYIDNIKILSAGSVNHLYASMSGTSMATPYTAATVALMKMNNGNMSNADIKTLLIDSASNSLINSHDAVALSDSVFNLWGRTGGVSSTSIYGVTNNDLFYQATVGINKRIYYRFRTNLETEWPRWQITTGKTSKPVAIDFFNDCYYISFRGDNNWIYTSKSCAGTNNWGPWIASGGSTLMQVGLASDDNRIYQAVVGGNSRIYTRYSTEGEVWSSWLMDTFITSKPTTLANYNGTIYQSAIGQDGAVYIRKMSLGYTWEAWQNIGGNPGASIAMEEHDGRLYLSYSNSKTSGIYIRSFSDASGWTREVLLSGSTIDRPNLVSFDGELYQFAVGGGGSLYERVTK